MANSNLNSGKYNQQRSFSPSLVFTTGQNAFTKEGIEELESIGVTDVVIGFRNVYEMEEDKPLEDKINMLKWYAGQFING